MSLNKLGITVLVVAACAAANPASVVAQTCGPEIGQIQRDMQAFDREVSAQNLDFLKNDVKTTALNGMQRHLAGNPTSDALFNLKAMHEQWNDWTEQVERGWVALREFNRCLSSSGSLSSCATNLARQQTTTDAAMNRFNDAFRQWIQSLGDDGLTQATERVGKATSLVQGYNARAMGLAENSLALSRCIGGFEQRAQAGGGDVVDPTQPAAPTPPRRSGMGSGAKIGLGVAAAGGGAIGLIYGMKAVEGALAPVGSPTTTTTTTTTSASPAPAANRFYANWTCNNSAQCISVRGHAMGSAGPFCTASACAAWNAARGTGTCTSQPQYPTMIWNFPPAGTCSN